MKALPMTEDQLGYSVCDLAARLGLHVAHFRPALTVKGWRTPVQGNGGAGFPDILAWGSRLLARELKQDGRYPDAVQRQRMSELRAAGVDVDVWRPNDWRSGRIESELRAISRHAGRGHRDG